MATIAPSRIARQSIRSLASQKCLPVRTFARAITTETSSVSSPQPPSEHPNVDFQPASSAPAQIYPLQHEPPANPFRKDARCTLHTFPGLEPAGVTMYPSTHLLLPLRKDLLHLAVTFEGDAERSGTASTKWRGEVHGSHKKMRPQKGTGRARLGTRQSPSIKGGGVAHGPKPRDFSTELPKKMYDLAFRIALSYRYRRGQLMILNDKADVEHIDRHGRARYLAELFQWHKMGHKQGRTLVITEEERPAMMEAFLDERLLWEAECLHADEVDVKNLLELGRVMIEKSALDRIFKYHQSDLGHAEKHGPWKQDLQPSEHPQLDIKTSVLSRNPVQQVSEHSQPDITMSVLS